MIHKNKINCNLINKFNILLITKIKVQINIRNCLYQKVRIWKLVWMGDLCILWQIVRRNLKMFVRLLRNGFIINL